MSGAAPAACALPNGARAALVVNPTARRHDRGAIDAVAATLRRRFVVDLVVPPSAADVERAVRAASAAHDAVVVAGGDGTIHRAVCGLDGAPTPLGVIPMGTGNDFARGCGIPLSPAGAAARVIDGRTRRLDLVRVNGRIYCTVGLIGAASDAALAIARLASPGSRWRGVVRALGDRSYRLAGLSRLLAPRAITEEVRVTDPSGRVLHETGPVHALFAANTRVLGGGLVLPIDADASDGLLDIALVSRMPRARLLWAFFCFARGRPVPEGTLTVHRAGRVMVSCARDAPFSADGDLMCRGRRFEIDVLPGALTLIA
jgi:diacylglycerol kinase (ATP)